MYLIVGKQNLGAVNEVADMSLQVIEDLGSHNEEKVTVDSNVLGSLASGYLFLYEAVLQAGLMPNTKSAKHNIFNLH
jgi:hypothetical protein